MAFYTDFLDHDKGQKSKARNLGFYRSPPTFASPYCLFKIELKSD
jgi:hypothetical protein